MGGTDAEYTVQVPFWEAIRGGEMKLNIQRPSAMGRMTPEPVSVPHQAGHARRTAHPAGRQGQSRECAAAPPGDLYIIVRIAEHPVFHRDADDISITLPILPWEAALGAKVEVPTIDGRAMLRIPPGTQSGQKLRMREKGVTIGHPARRHRRPDRRDHESSSRRSPTCEAKELWQQAGRSCTRKIRAAELWSKM